MNKKTLLLVVVLALTLAACTKNPLDDDSLVLFNECLAQEGMVIYGSEWCPACQSLVSTLGGKEAVAPVYVECTQEQERCAAEKLTGYVPEIQLRGEVYAGARTIAALAEATGCPEP